MCSGKVNVKPVFDKILCEVIDTKETTDEVILLPESLQEQNIKYAKIISVGPGKYENGTFVSIPSDIKVGSTIILNKFGGVEFTLEKFKDKHKFLLINANEILAIMEED